MKVKDTFLGLGSFILKEGKQIRFWEDVWIGNQPFKVQYPSLYNLVCKKSDTVANVFETIPLNISFRRALVGHNLVSWHSLVSRLVNIQLTNEKDVLKWNLTSSGLFSVKSMYGALLNNPQVFYNKALWKLKVPLKIKIFMWYLIKGVVLTKDNLAKRNWHGNKKCVFCTANESIQHLFIDCHFAKFVWRLVQWCFGLSKPRSVRNIFGAWLTGVPLKTKKLIITGASAACWAIWISRNDLVFNKTTMLTSLQVLFRMTHWLRCWTFLHNEEAKNKINQACRCFETVAMQFYSKYGWSFSNRIQF
jgi:hypothetical protein